MLTKKVVTSQAKRAKVARQCDACHKPVNKSKGKHCKECIAADKREWCLRCKDYTLPSETQVECVGCDAISPETIPTCPVCKHGRSGSEKNDNVWHCGNCTVDSCDGCNTKMNPNGSYSYCDVCIEKKDLQYCRGCEDYVHSEQKEIPCAECGEDIDCRTSDACSECGEFINPGVVDDVMCDDCKGSSDNE
jgi:hypothetical protein